MKTRLLRFTLLLLAFAMPCVARCADAPAAAAKPEAPAFKALQQPMQLADGDTVVFLGDSITHQCLYTQYVEDFYYTRYPKLHIHFHNAGVSGDRAGDALTRFDDDVAACKPRYVTILLGMNDGAYYTFDKDVFALYQKDMSALLDRLAAIGATAVPITPTMYDSRAARLRGKNNAQCNTYYNGVLALYGAWLREVAEDRGLGFVDMYSPLNDLTFGERKKDPRFTLIPDAIHPGPAGQVVMASAVLSDACPRSAVSSITILQRSGKPVAQAANGKVTDLTGNDEGVCFTFAANALPWVVPDDAAPGYELVHGGHHFSNEAIAARNLKPGKYELKIDGQPVGTWLDGQLAFRVELEGNVKTPQHQQALRVAQLNQERNDKAVHPLRDLWSQVKHRRQQLAHLASANDPKLAAEQEQFDKWYAGEFKEHLAKLQTLARQYEDRIYEAAQPVARKYELVRVK